jgi:hypothetical protein
MESDARRFGGAMIPRGSRRARRRGGGDRSNMVGCLVVWLGVALIGLGARALACPFCAAIANTLTDDMREATVAVLGTLSVGRQCGGG